jgi:endonuclease/exonuclease/phosphatase family metal-dependent hydrolase
MQDAVENRLRLVSYNILEGLRPLGAVAAERRALDRDRAACAKAVVADLRPDILVLNEALFCRAHDGHELDYADIFNFPHQAAALYDGAWGNAILSRFAIQRAREFRIHDRGGLVVEIETPTGALAVASYHPHPDRSPEDKARDLSALIADIEGPLLLCGDLNSINPDDALDVDGLIAGFAAFSATPRLSARRFVESGEVVFAAMTRLGLRDAVPGPGRRYSVPTDLINADKQSAMRIDHILASAEVAVFAGEVVHSAATNRASDHHPVVVDFTLAAK